jgi:hypothetical protein
MKKFGMAAFAAVGLIGMTLGLAPPVLAMPAEVESAPDTVNRLQSEGYTVILNKVGSGARGACTVTAVRPGQRFLRTDSGVPGAMGDFTVTQLSKTVYVDVKC